MKFVLLLSLISFSSVSFAKESASNAEVIQAIKDSLSVKNLNCLDSVTGQSFRASESQWDNIAAAQMTINQDQQPVLTFKSTEPKSEMIVTVTTNSDLTIVEEIKAVVSSFTKTTKNVGTIVKPQYKEIITKNVLSNIKCK